MRLDCNDTQIYKAFFGKCVVSIVFEPVWINQLTNYGGLDVFSFTITDRTILSSFYVTPIIEEGSCSQDLMVEM